MDARALVDTLKSIYVWIPYSSPVPKNRLAQLIQQLGGQLPAESELNTERRQQN